MLLGRAKDLSFNFVCYVAGLSGFHLAESLSHFIERFIHNLLADDVV